MASPRSSQIAGELVDRRRRCRRRGRRCRRVQLLRPRTASRTGCHRSRTHRGSPGRSSPACRPRSRGAAMPFATISPSQSWAPMNRSGPSPAGAWVVICSRMSWKSITVTSTGIDVSSVNGAATCSMMAPNLSSAHTFNAGSGAAVVVGAGATVVVGGGRGVRCLCGDGCLGGGVAALTVAARSGNERKNHDYTDQNPETTLHEKRSSCYSVVGNAVNVAFPKLVVNQHRPVNQNLRRIATRFLQVLHVLAKPGIVWPCVPSSIRWPSSPG